VDHHGVPGVVFTTPIEASLGDPTNPLTIVKDRPQVPTADGAHAIHAWVDWAIERGIDIAVPIGTVASILDVLVAILIVLISVVECYLHFIRGIGHTSVSESIG
jgi:hypothetical protein